jgi:glutathione peroxidase
MNFLKIAITAFAGITLTGSSIYNLSFTNTEGNNVSMNQYQGKKILLVNTATGSPRASQFAELEQLYQQHKDSMVVIAFSSNSFGNEPKSDATLKNYLQTTYGVSFVLAQKTEVTGNNMGSIYQWLTKRLDNGVMNTRVKGDFQKYLINKQGHLVAVFDTATSPLDGMLQQAIHISN